jgi:hypothetical protein
MKKLMIGMILAGLTVTSAFANGDDAGQANNTSPAMEAQPQTGNTDQTNANINGNVSGNMAVSGTVAPDASQN